MHIMSQYPYKNYMYPKKKRNITNTKLSNTYQPKKRPKSKNYKFYTIDLNLNYKKLVKVLIVIITK